jgi:hypothetical protein
MQLAERVCADSREEDSWEARCDAPASDALHQLFRQAGGRLTIHQEFGGEVFMAKLLDPLAVLRGLTDVFAERAAAAGIARPAELGIELRAGGGRVASRTAGVVERFRARLSRRTATIETGGPSRHSIALGYCDLAPLVLGDCGAQQMIQSGRARATTEKARQFAAALLPGDSWWRPPLDDLLA